MKGYFLLHRAVFDHELAPKDRAFTEFEAWVWLLARASHTQKPLMIDGQKTMLDTGELYCSLTSLAASWQWSWRRVKRFLKHLESCRAIDIANVTQKVTRLKVTNYAYYQQKETSHCTSNVTGLAGQTSDKELNINNRLKDFTPSPETSAWCIKNYPALDFNTELEKFKEHYLAKGVSFGDCNLALKRWCRKAQEIRQQNTHKYGYTGRPTQVVL